MHPLADAGRVIAGRYRLLEPVGRGAMGIVWRARDQLLDRDVAIKEVQIAETLTDAERVNAYQRTLREAKTAARLNHPAVVTVYDVAEDEGRPWIVMQLIVAQSLDQVLATSGPLSPRRAAEVGRQLLSALTVAHAAGVLHRDVKPSNVLLGADDRAVLTDFGIATFQGDPRLTQTGMVMGSPGFTAPERIRGGDASPASDLWSLGATLYAAVEGHGPFERRGGAITTMSAIINEDAPDAPTAGALGPVISALLRREPEDRPDAVAAMRMMSDVIPLLPARAEPGPAGYEPTALSQAPPVVHTSQDALTPGVAPSAGPGLPSAGTPAAVAGTDGYPPFGGQIAPTKPQPGSGDSDNAPSYGGSAPSYGGSVPAYGGSAPQSSPQAPPDFSSWYGSAPQPAPSASAYQPTVGPGGWPGAPPQWSGAAPRSDVPPGSAPGQRRRSGLWWKIGLLVLALLGAGAGAAVVLLNHGNPGSAQGKTTPTVSASGTGSTTTLPPADLQITAAINMQRPGPLPAGFKTFSQGAQAGENAGWSLAGPAGWAMSTGATSYQTYLRDPSATGVNILIDLTPHTYPADMLREARFIERQSLVENRFPGYRQQGLSAIPIRGTAGSYWKFTWQDGNTEQEAIDLLFVLQTPSGSQSYALYMTGPYSTFGQFRPIFDEMVETFLPLT
jgi:eukaryotic-like serine/threonine-protein kinase